VSEDQWDPAKLPAGMTYRGDLRRERPIVDEQPIGPWRARVRITPLLGWRDKPLFEVSVHWENGPPLLAFNEHWDGTPQQATDQATTTDVELARAVALEAVDQLRNGVRFDLQTLMRERRARA
jgi:hypothetical protein